MPILALGIDLLMLKNNCRASCHLNAELIRLSEAAAATRPVLRHALSRLLHAGEWFGTAFDHPGLISTRSIRIEIACQVAQHHLVCQQPHPDPGTAPEPS